MLHNIFFLSLPLSQRKTPHANLKKSFPLFFHPLTKAQWTILLGSLLDLTIVQIHMPMMQMMKTILFWNMPDTSHCAFFLPIQIFWHAFAGLAQIPHMHLSRHTIACTQHIPEYIFVHPSVLSPL
jgi:hypothetical protein